jgi:hypothetical protein
MPSTELEETLSTSQATAPAGLAVTLAELPAHAVQWRLHVRLTIIVEVKDAAKTALVVERLHRHLA